MNAAPLNRQFNHDRSGRLEVDYMKKVKFVRVRSELSGYGFGKGTKYSFDGVEDIIREHIQDGWSFEGYVPVTTRGTGDIEELSLIFQREE